MQGTESEITPNYEYSNFNMLPLWGNNSQEGLFLKSIESVSIDSGAIMMQSGPEQLQDLESNIEGPGAEIAKQGNNCGIPAKRQLRSRSKNNTSKDRSSTSSAKIQPINCGQYPARLSINHESSKRQKREAEKLTGDYCNQVLRKTIKETLGSSVELQQALIKHKPMQKSKKHFFLILHQVSKLSWKKFSRKFQKNLSLKEWKVNIKKMRKPIFMAEVKEQFSVMKEATKQFLKGNRQEAVRYAFTRNNLYRHHKTKFFMEETLAALSEEANRASNLPVVEEEMEKESSGVGQYLEAQ